MKTKLNVHKNGDFKLYLKYSFQIAATLKSYTKSFRKEV